MLGSYARSLRLTRRRFAERRQPYLKNPRRPELLAAARDLFAVIKSKKVKISVNQTYPLRDAARAQDDLESRKTTGSTVLIP